eukprot:Skav204865  [mRNA]  locus=scaffold1679:22578:30000:- [translate_table: standard]
MLCLCRGYDGSAEIAQEAYRMAQAEPLPKGGVGGRTAAYALAPIQHLARQKGESLQLRVSPQANEIVQTSMSLDCQGKKGNVGFKVVTRAVSKLAETLEEEEDDPSSTWQYNDSVAEDTVIAAVHAGFVHIDTAYDYHNQAVSYASQHLKSKVPGCGIQNTSAKTIGQCRAETEDKIGMDLQQLNLTYLDLANSSATCLISPDLLVLLKVLVHFPPCPGDDGSADSPSKSSCSVPQNGCTHPQSCDMIKAQWSVLTDAYKKKQIRAIGVSNYCRACLECLTGSEVFPMVNQMEILCPQSCFHFLAGKGNLTTSIGKAHGKSAAQANANIFDFALSDAEMASLDKATFAAED